MSEIIEFDVPDWIQELDKYQGSQKLQGLDLIRIRECDDTEEVQRALLNIEATLILARNSLDNLIENHCKEDVALKQMSDVLGVSITTIREYSQEDD